MASWRNEPPFIGIVDRENLLFLHSGGFGTIQRDDRQRVIPRFMKPPVSILTQSALRSPSYISFTSIPSAGVEEKTRQNT